VDYSQATTVATEEYDGSTWTAVERLTTAREAWQVQEHKRQL
jgi:hypothetical protein